jgi:hypothetical protein
LNDSRDQPDSTAQPGEVKKSWVDLARQTDPRTGRPRAWVNLDPSDADMTAWKEIEDATAGQIGLQCHTGNVQFQNVMIRSRPD